jgi:hypothetical protein
MSSAEWRGRPPHSARDRGRRLRAELISEERKLWARLRASAVADSDSPPAPDWSLLCRFLLCGAAPDYRTRRHSACRAAEERKDGLRTAYLNGVLGVLELGGKHRVGRCAAACCKLFISPDGFLIARHRRRADKGPSLGAQKKGAVLPLSGEDNYAQIDKLHWRFVKPPGG